METSTSTAVRRHAATSAPLNGSLTQTITPTSDPDIIPITLIRPQARVRRTIRQANNTLQVEWSDSVVDNEGLNRKSSKKCCVFKKKKAFDESSDESDWEERFGEGANDNNNTNNNHSHHHECSHHNHDH